MNRLDEMFTTGPETLVAQSSAIIAGQVSHYSKEVEEQSQGNAPIPVRWVISGELEHPETLKGEAPKCAVRFSRVEQSPFLAQPEPLQWEGADSQWQQADKAVVFFGSRGEILRVLPSGTGERDLIALVWLIVSISASGRRATEQAVGWQRHLSNGGTSSGESKRIALRELLKLTPSWNQVASTLHTILSGNDADLRQFAFGIVAYEITHDKWRDASEPAKFLCTRLRSETNAEVAESHREYVDLMQRFADREGFREQRKALRDHLRDCLNPR